MSLPTPAICDSDLREALSQFAAAWSIPPGVSGQDVVVRIGSCAYNRFPGIFAYKVYGELNAIGLKKDGTWHKYGDAFDSPQQAYETLLKTTHRHWGD